MIKLDTLVREFMVESLGAEQIDMRYSRILQIAISGLRELNLDMPDRTFFKTLDINANDTVTLPNGYVDYVRIGVCYNGQILALGENPNMCPPETDACGNVEICQPNTVNTSTDPAYTAPFGMPFYISGSYFGRRYGIGGGNNAIGYYKVWEKEGFIALQGMDTQFDQIILEYIGSLEEVDGEFLVHEYDAEAIKAWIWYKWIQRAKSYNNYDKEEARRTFNNARRNAVGRHGRMSANEFLQAIRSGYKSSPKL